MFFAVSGVQGATAGAGPVAPTSQLQTAPPTWGTGMRLSGRKKLRFLGFEIYQASLWVRPGFQAETWDQQGFVLELAYLRDFTSAAIAQRSLQEMRKLAPLSDEQAARWQAQLNQVLPDVRSGDRVAGIHLPGIGARFQVNGQPAGEMLDAEFARLFFGIWLSPATSEPGLRQALLAQSAR